MKPTAALEKSPYIKQILASFGEVLSRSRLMRLAPGAQVPLHSDINYHWYKRVRVHIPITTTEQVQFYCHDKQVHMGAGECWIFDSWKYHKVENNSDQYRVHLVIDLAGSSAFWRTIFNHSRAIVAPQTPSLACSSIDYQPEAQPEIITEQYNAPIIMPVAEVEYLTNELLAEVKHNPQNPAAEIDAFNLLIAEFVADWRMLWLQFECQQQGWPQYHALRERTMKKAMQQVPSLQLAYSGSAVKAFEQLVIVACMNIELNQTRQSPPTQAAQAKPRPSPQPSVMEPSATAAPQQEIAAPPTRNTPCPCGSGKRYKACHGKMS
ncbi:aspartyl/asparaginyl beta-hydroxylase domain-containing protein [Shewanella phaeophyticola]|uniref:Aspartyl/asparaginyl beta-hydroxylase domain-containing protein n=1 Tax=Shewanella phaeophyticola TaxID=2978345 RepID=A0ABT2P485_9GAMM|nr:aspartyl/asparaginyl beta-hydroxylase domain-containing protein [Shewanella sp. KJ10-1]MCT8987467.1 aspartyl/asparaginyl beta-hydroxylase domain-containing protein [Shewanella sp. KJ10-1]